jgi:hypothetical protein
MTYVALTSLIDSNPSEPTYVFSLKMSEVIKTRGQDAVTDALNSEFSSLYDTMKALVPCFSHSLKMPLHLLISEKEFERVKARIVIGGNLQTGIEDIETHSHCIRNETVFLLLSVATHETA